MIYFTREGTQVVCNMTATVPTDVERTFFFRWEAENDWSAGLFVQFFQTKTSDELKRVRQEAYDEGWRDAKKKSRRRGWFSGVW